MHIILGNQHNHNHRRHHSGHVAEESSVDNLLGSRSNLLKRRQLLHDFWLIVQVEAGRGAATGSESGLSVNIFFCQRAFLLHDQLFESACRLVEEQIRLVNQEVLLERMHQTEECDQLLVDHDFAPQLKASYGLRSMGSLDPAGVGAATRPVPGEALTRAVSAKLALQSSSSLLMEGADRTATAPMPSTVVSHVRDNSLTYSDEEGDHSVGALNELVRCKFRPGHFACEMVWHHWFAIHPRLQPSRTFSGGNDIGFKALRLGLEGLAVRNRSNMYVYKERNGNVVYLRLHATEESILGNIPGGNCSDWEEEVRKRSHNCILLAVHGVRPPGEEITEQLMNVLQRRLNSRTLEEIQNALLKNAHIRLEWSDIKFIQREPDNPNAVFFFTVPQLARHHLGSVKYYLSQQMLTFCISPKFREQSGAALHRGKYSGSASTTGVHYFSGGGTGTSRALSLAGTPTLEHHHHYHHQWTTKGSMEGRESLQHTFVPFTVPNTQSNPAGYLPTFYLVNKPPGEGKRDTGIACLEVRLVDWRGRLMDHVDESRLDADGRLILLRGGDTSDPIQKVSRMNEMSKCVRVNHVGPEVQPMPNTCALFQFNMWQNGNVGVDELENRLRMCVHQAICDLVTEFGLLSMPLFETALSPIRSKAGSFSISNTTPPPLPPAQHASGVHHQNSNSAAGLKPYSSSELPKPQSAQSATGPPNADGFVSPILTTAVGSSAPNHSPVKPFGQQQNQQQKMGADPVGVASRSERNPVTMPLMGRHQRQLQSPILFTGDDQHQQQQQQQQLQHLQSLEHEHAPGELLRADFVAVADVWFGHVINETKGSPEMSHSIRKFQFRLDSDTSAKKIVQVVEQKLGVLLKNERLVVCRNAPVVETAHPRRHFLKTLNSLSSLLDDPTERDLGRLVNVVSKGAEPPELVLIAFNEQISQDTLRMAHDSSAYSASIAKFADHTQIGGGSSAQCHDVVVADSRKSSAVTGRISTQRAHPLDSQEMDEEEEEMRIWRSSHEPMQMFARRMSCVSSLGCWRNRTTAPVGGVDPSALMMPANTTTAAAANSASILSSRISLSKFLPCTKPFIPRQRLLYLLVRGETINLFLYNYTNDVVAKAREIVERCTLWHNARSRLLREIGLHKMGITHLSTLKSADARLNSYMLLTWMDPETLVNNDYPVDSLTTPDFSNIPRIYAQLLLKLYRFADPAFVAKGISPWVFEDQTQQMLALREEKLIWTITMKKKKGRTKRKRRRKKMRRGKSEGEGFCNSSTTADDGTIAELTMPLNDSSEYDPLLREIGLHKMGITHLSTLKSADARLNSYMLLTWMDPETLVNNDYPVDSLTTPDFSNIPRIYAQLLLKLYRFADPAFVAKGISPWVFEDQTQQMLALREDVRSMLNDHRLFTEVHNALRMETSDQKLERRQPRWTQETATAVDPSLPEEVLAQLVGRSHEVHFVMSPLLLFPSWRRRVAAIRTGAAAVETTDVVRTQPGVVGTATACLDKHGNAAAAHSIRKKQEGAVKALGQFPPSADASVSAMSCRRYPMDPEEEPCVLRIQQLLIEDYLSYLRSIGLQIVHIERATNSPQPIVGPTCGLVQQQQQHHHQFEQHLSSGSVGSMSSSTVGHQQKHVQTGKHHHQQQQQNASHLHQKGKPTQSSTEALLPEVWLYKALDGGILFVQLSFMQPFFCLRIFAFHAAPQLDEHLRSNQQQRKNCARLEDNVHSVRLLEQAKNELIRQCHVHSFVYDFHLRMVMRYLVGEGQVMFNPGYNINAFLIDFLQYYACRPPLARNCVYEEIVHCSDLKVSALSIWEHFMCSEQRFGWKVIRLKNLDSSDEFMLIAKERRAAFGLDYELVRVVINPREQREKEHRITLKLYVLLVTEMTETSPTAREEGIAETATRDEAVEQKGSMAPEGGEFTELVNNSSSNRNVLKRTDQQQQFVVPKEDDDDNDHDHEDEDGDEQKNSPSLCSTLIGPAWSESKMTKELVDDTEEENGGTFTTPAAAAEEAKEDALTGVEGGTDASASSTFAPMGHRRRGHPHIQRPVVSSSGTLGHRLPVDSLKAVVPSQLVRADYCYECVLAAAAELQRSTGFGAARHRRRFCSGGVLLGASAARRTDAARMSLPPSRTSTASTSSSIRKMAKKQHSLSRQRSESSQLSTESRVNILQAKKQHSNASFGADEHGSMTPANSLKGLSEWRTNQQLNQTKLGKDWTLLEEEQHQWENSHNSRQKLAIQIGHPPRRHRAHQHQRGRGAQTTSACWEANDRTSADCERGAVLPSEQVTYLHYLSSRQRRLQILLEEEVHADRLVQFVRDADSFCYVDTLWKSLLASRTFQFPGQRAQSLFISSTSSKTLDFFPDAFVKRPTAISSDLEPFDFEAMLHVVGVEAVAKREPRVIELLRGLNWTALCRFLVQLFEGERRCRYFESSVYSYLVITNPQFLDSAALFRHSLSNGDTELFLVFKRADDVYWKSKTDAVVDAFAGQAIRKLLKEVGP
uniref:SH2 domain-containing protein n=1 Tax=Globodera pallida TaxID=36090 RepID=A0A183C3E2_GLOPA